MGLTSISIEKRVRDRLRALSHGVRNNAEALTRLLDRWEMEEYLEDLRRRVDDPEYPWKTRMDWD